MNTNPPNPGARAVHAAARLVSCVSLILLGHPFVAMAQVPTSIDASSRANANVSWETGMGNYAQTTIAQATASAARSGTAVSTLTLTNAGANYAPPPARPPIVRITGGNGTGATATATVGPDGKIVSLVLTNGGSGYTSNPTVEIAAAPGGVGSSINFNNDISGNRIISLDGNRTVGRLILGDLNTSNRYTIDQGTGGSLFFDNAGNGGGAYLNKFTGNLDTISAPIVLNDRLNIRVTTNRLVLSNTITGNGNKLTSFGNGVLELTGDNTDSGFNLEVWNKGSNNANPQVLLNSTVGNAVSGNVTIGNASRGTTGHAVLQLEADRTHFDQISDSATVKFDSYAGSGRNNYFKLMGGDETIGRLLDLGSLAIIENRESERLENEDGETANTGAVLTLAGAGNSYVSGYIRDNTGGATAQADARGTAGDGPLALNMQGAGTLSLSGGNIIFTGGLTIGENSTVSLRQTTNFRSDIRNDGTLIMDTGTLGATGLWNFRKVFAAPAEGEALISPRTLKITGQGNIIKTGIGILQLDSPWIQGRLSVMNGTLNLFGNETGSLIGSGIVVQGDAGLGRTVNFNGRHTVLGGIDGTGRFNNVNSALNVRAGIFSAGDLAPSSVVDGLLTVSGDIRLNYMDLRLGGSTSFSKVVAASVVNSQTLTITNSESIVVGMRLESNSGGAGIAEDTYVTGFNPVTRVVTLNKNVSIGQDANISFVYDSHTSGVLGSGDVGGLGSLTLIGRPGVIGTTTNGGALLLQNSQYSNNTNRVPDSAAINLKGGLIELMNDSTANLFSEKLGTVTLREGNSQIIVHRSGDAAPGKPAGSTLTLAALNRSYGTTVEFGSRQTDGGVTNITELVDGTYVPITNYLGTDLRNRVMVEQGLVMDDGIVGGWAHASFEFVKYSATNGITQLTEQEYETSLPNITGTTRSATWSHQSNIKLGIEGAASTTTSVAGKVAINSLNIRAFTDTASNRAITLSANAILSIESGGLMSSNGSNTVTGSGSSGYVTVGSAKNTPAELMITVGTTKPTQLLHNPGVSTLTLNSAVRDFNFTQTSTGVSMASGSDVMTVPGNLYALLMVGMEVTHRFLPAGTTITEIDRNNKDGVTIRLSNSATSALTSGTGLNEVEFKGGSVGLTKSGPGNLLLSPTLVYDYTGPTIINNGLLSLRSNGNIGAVPSQFVSNQLQLNGGTLQFRRENELGEIDDRNKEVDPYSFTFNDGNRGIYVGESGGRLEVGHVNPAPKYTLTSNGQGTEAKRILNVEIKNAIDAYGVLELAVRGSPGLSPAAFNTLTLGSVSSTNNYRGGIKTEGTYEGVITINGSNYINGLLLEGSRMTIQHDNDFSGPIRVVSGQLTLNGSNTYNQQPNFTDFIVVGAGSAGTLTLGSNTALGTEGFKINLGSSSQLRLFGSNQKILSLVSEETAIISNGYSRPAGTDASLNRPSTVTVDLAVNEIYTGRFSNGGTSPLNLVKTGEGRLALTNLTSDFSGTITILQGMLNVNSVNRAGNSSGLGRGVNGAASEIIIDNGGLSFTTIGVNTTNRSFTMGAGVEGAILVANSAAQASRIILGEDVTSNAGTINESRIVSQPVGFVGDGARTLTLSGTNLGDNEFRLQLSDKSLTEPTSLMKMGSGVWAMAATSDYSGQTTVQDGVLAVLKNNALGTTSIPTTVNLSTDTLTGNMPNGVEISFPRLVNTRLPGGIDPDTRYYVVQSDSTALTFKVATERNGSPINLVELISGPPSNVRFVPNIQTEATTVASAATDTFTGNLPNGTAVVFGYQVPLRTTGNRANTVITTVLPGGILATSTYYVINATGTTFQVATSLGSQTPVNITSNSIGPIYYQASLTGNTSGGVHLVGGRLDLRDVDYMTPETITFQGGAMSVPDNTSARWAGNWNVQANSVLTVAAGSELVMDGNLLGTRAMTMQGEGTLILRGESIMPTQPNSATAEMDNNRRGFSVQAGMLILDYTLNNNSKLVDSSPLTLGGGRRGAELVLKGGNHQEVVSATTIGTGASSISRVNDGGTSFIRLNTVSRQIGATLYFDLARIATVNNLNTSANILGGWAIIRDAVTPAYRVITGTVSRSFVADSFGDVLAVPTPEPFNPVQAAHYLVDGTPVRLTTTGTLPAPLQTGRTYYVVSAGTSTFKVSETPFGMPVDLLDEGSEGPQNQHTVTTYQPERTSPASILFTANPNAFPGASGNDTFIIQIEHTTGGGNITSSVSGGLPTPEQPNNRLLYTIRTTATSNSASAIVAHVRSTVAGIQFFNVSISSPDTTTDTSTVIAAPLAGGSNDNGSQGLTWATNGSNMEDGWVQVFADYSLNNWTRDRNVDVNPTLMNGEYLPIDPVGNVAYTLRYASNEPSVMNLSRNELYTLQSGAILVSPTVGQNDSSLIGQGTLTTENSGNVGNFLIHQYNELGDLVIGLNLADRETITRSGRLTSGNRRILSAVDFASSVPPLRNGDPSILEGAVVTVVPNQAVLVTTVPANTVVEEILEYGVRLNNETTGNDVRAQMLFTVSPTESYLIFATQQSLTAQNRINGIINSEGVMTTADIYLGMPVVGPGIPAGAVVDLIPTDTDIRINTNHFFNGLYTTFQIRPTVGLDKTGRGTLVLSGDNTYTGITFLADGVIRAMKLTDGGVAGSLGAASLSNANINFNGGTLQYTGENTSTNRGMTISDFGRINIGHEKTTAVFSGGISLSGSIGAADRLEKVGTGTLEMRGSGSLNELTVQEGKLRIQVIDLNAAPQTTTASSLAANGVGSVRLGGGVLEVRGLPEADATQNFGGTLYVDEGSSTVRAISVSGFNSNNLNQGLLPRSTNIILMGGEESGSAVRSSGGTVHFVEAPEANAGSSSIFLNTATSRAQILPWAVYEDGSNMTRPGVNDFAVVSLLTGAVQASDLLGLHRIDDNVMNPNAWTPTMNPSEGGTYAVSVFSGVTTVAGSPFMVVDSSQEENVRNLRVGMQVTGVGISADTNVIALDFDNLIITLNKPVAVTAADGSYFFQQERTFSGTVASGTDLVVNTLRYASGADSIIEIAEGSSVTFTSGAILVGAATRGGAKNILGDGTITSRSAAGLGTDFVVHNYNPVAPFTIGVSIVDSIVRGVYSENGAPPVAAGSLVAGQAILTMPDGAFDLVEIIHEGMEIRGAGLPPNTFVTGKFQNQIFLSKAATSSTTGQLYTFYSTTSFVQSGTGTTILSGNNLYTGQTFVHGGVLRLDSANAVPGGIKDVADVDESSHLIIKGGVLGLGYEDFTRDLGAANNQVEFKGSGGFAAYGADRLVDFGGEGADRRLRFGNDSFVFDGSTLILGAGDATHKVTLVNSIDLGSFSQAIRVDNGPADIEGEISGILHGVGRMIKFGLGTLRLSGENEHTGGFEIAEGRLVVANVPNALGVGDGVVTLGTSFTNSSPGAGIKLEFEGGTINKNIVIGGVNSRASDWVEHSEVGGSESTNATHSSMILVNGNPAFAYYDPADQNLKFVRANDPRGLSWLPPVIVSSRGDVGQYPSLGIINNNPAISYYDATNTTLCYVRANDISGVTWGVPVIADPDPVSSVALQTLDGKVIIGGTFVEFDGVVRTRLARLLTSGALDTAFNPVVDGEVREILVLNDNSILIGGDFSKVNGVERTNMARLNVNGTLVESYNPAPNGAVNVMLLQPGDGKLLVGGNFTNIGGLPSNRLGRLNTNGTADTGFGNPGVNEQVYAIALDSANNILIGGAFTRVKNTTRNRIARLTPTGELDVFNPNSNGTVRAIVVSGDLIYVGGAFATFTGTDSTTTVTRNRLARLNQAGVVDSSFALEVNAEIRGMKLLNSNKIAFYGVFTTVGQEDIAYLGRLNADGSLDTAFRPNPDYEVRDVVEQADGKLVIGGLFSRVSGATQHFAGRLNVGGNADSTFTRKFNNRGQYSSLSHVAAFPAVSYYDAVKGNIRYVRATNISGTAWGDSMSVLRPGETGRNSVIRVTNIGGDLVVKDIPNNVATVSIPLANNGTPAIAYHDPAGGSLKYVLSNNALGTDWSAPVVVDSNGTVGEYLSMELINGMPAIAYYNQSNGNLQYIRALNVAGLTSNLRAPDGAILTKSLDALAYNPAWGVVQTLDSANNVGLYPSLAVIQGKSAAAVATPAVAYYDQTNGNLRYIKANNATGVATGNPAPPAWGAPVTVQSQGNVGQYAQLVVSDGLAGIGYYDVTNSNLKYIHFSDATGYSQLAAHGDTDLEGNLELQGTLLLAPELGTVLTLNGALTGAGGFRIISEGSVLINGEANDFGSAFDSGDQAPVTIRTGSLLLGSNAALGGNRVDLGDRAGNLRPSNAVTLPVDRATRGTSITAGGGRFDTDHNGLADNAGGRGAFVNVSSTIDGFVYTSANVNQRILVKDETAAPGRNGVYRIVYAAAQPPGTMNLVRVADLDEVAEFVYGFQVEVANGSSAGRAFFLASVVQAVNVSPVRFAEVLTADRATTGTSLIAMKGSFDPFHNGQFGSTGGPGAFVEVDTEIDGRTYSVEDEGTLILVKDELKPEWNGVYRIQYASGVQLDGTMNLVRAGELDELAEFTYGLQVRVTSGTHAGEAFFLASEVLEMNVTPVLWMKDVPDGDLALRGNVDGLDISNVIDLNSRIGAGKMVLGAVESLTSGAMTFSGPITLQDNQTRAVERQTLHLDSNIMTDYGVTISGVISEERGTSSSGAPADILSLVKTGDGVVTLRAANTFNGGVTVNAGTLLAMNMTGSATGTGTVTVNAGAVLGGMGIISGPVILNGTGNTVDTRATLRVGDPKTTTGIEVLTISGPLTVGANSVVEFTIGTNNITRLAADTVTITPTGLLLVKMEEGFTPMLLQPFDIFNGTINFTGGSDILLSEYLKLPGAFEWDTSTFLTDGIVRATKASDPVEIITEPAAPAAALNPGESYTLRVVVEGSPQFRYQWQKRVAGGTFVNVGPAAKDTDLTESSLVLASVTEGDEAEYRVIITNRDDFSSATSAIVFIDVNDPPTIVVAPASQEVNPGSTATFTVQAETPPGLTMSYQWRRGTTLLNDLPRYSGANTDTLVITDVVEADQSSFYNVVVTNIAGSTVSGFFMLDVRNPITITSQPKDAVVNNGETATFGVTVALATSIPVTYQWQWNRGVEGGGFVDIQNSDLNDPANGISNNVSNARILRIPNLLLADSGFSVRVRIFNPVGDVTSEAATLTVVEGGGLPKFLDQPASQTVLVGSTVQLVARVGGDPAGRVIQWKRGKANVRLGDIKSGGMISNVSVTEEVVNTITTRSILTITNISPALMGEYSAIALNKDIVTVKDAISSEIAQVAVVSNDPEAVITVQGNGKEKAVMSVVVKAPKGVEIIYEWLKDGMRIEPETAEGDRIVGLGTSKLTINQVMQSDAGLYSVLVTGPGDDDRRTVEGGTHDLKVYSAAPVLLPITFPPAMVGAYFEYKIPVDFGVDGSQSPVSYRATGLPAGLKLNKKTGWIRGIPTKAAIKTVTISAINKIKPVATTAPNNPVLEVQPIPAGAIGTFAGWIPRSELNGQVGGRFDLKTNAKGTFTGKVTIGLKAYPFKGALDLEPATNGVPGAPPSVTVTVLRKGKPVLSPMTLTFVMNPVLDRLASASLTADGDTVNFNAWRNLWSKLEPALPYVGYHTFALMPPDGSVLEQPMGASFGYFTVKPDGKLTMAVKMADGQAFTGGQFVGPLGEIMIYKVLYKTETRGSVVGQIRLLKNDEAKFADNTINSSPSTAPSWLRPADPAQKIPIYKDGFGPITLTAVGGAYEDPNRAWPDPAVNPRYPLILGLPNRADNRDNAMIEFNVDADRVTGINHIGGSPNLPTLYTDSLPEIYSTDAIDVTEGSKVTVPKPGSIDNPYGTTLSVVPKTGMFRGKLMLEGYDNDELTARRTTYQGIIVQTAEGLRGVGYYLVANRLPEVTDNKKTLPQVSDQVYFAPYTPPVVEPDPEPTP